MWDLKILKTLLKWPQNGHKMGTQEKQLDHIDMINTLRDYGLSRRQRGAERVGFEPTLRYKRKHAFQACALSHSATSPKLICLNCLF